MPITHEWNGTILTITSDSGTSSCDLKGEKGDDGCRGPQGRTGLTIGADGVIDTSGLATTDYVDYEINKLDVAGTAEEAVNTLVDGNYSKVIVANKEEKILNIKDAENKQPITLKSDIELVQEGEGEPTPDNIRPLSGKDKILLWRHEKNLFSTEFKYSVVKRGFTITLNTDGTITITGNRTGTGAALITIDFPIYLPVGTYTLKANNNKVVSIGEGMENNILMWGRVGNSYTEGVYCNSLDNVITHTSTKNPIEDIRIRIGANIQSIDNLILKPQVEYGAVATDYELYDGVVITAELPETVYKGVIDWNTGEVKSRPYYASYNGESLSGEWVSSMDVYTEGATPSIGAAVIDLSGTETVYQLTPQRLTLQKGINNIISDSGKTNIEYTADTKLYIDSKFEELTNAIVSLGGVV